MTGTRFPLAPIRHGRTPVRAAGAQRRGVSRGAAAALLLAGLALARPALAQDTASRSLVIRGVTVIDPSSGARPRSDQVIVIVDGIIRAVGPAASVKIPDGVEVLDGAGRYAIPGLWDMHVHFMNTGVRALPMLVANGVTSVREMGGYIDSTRAWQSRMAAGTLVGPRIETAGPILESPAWLQQVRERDAALGGRLAPRILPYRIGVGTPADARRAVDSLVRLHVDFVKVRTTASPESYYAILAAARRAGLSVVGHQPSVVSIADASDSGQKSIEHEFVPPLSRLDSASRADIYRRLVHNGTWYTPTLVASRRGLVSGDSAMQLLFGDSLRARDPRRAFASPALLDWWRLQAGERQVDTSAARRDALREAYHSSVDDVRAMRVAGVRLLAGTDAGSLLVYPGYSLHEELRLLVEEAGLSTREALWSATVGPAEFFGLESTLGTIAPGKTADIVLLNADPLANIRSTRHISAVIQGGRLFRRSALRSLLLQARGTGPS